MILFFTTIAVLACIIIGALFLLSSQSRKGGFTRYVQFRKRLDKRVGIILQSIYRYTHANRGLYKYQLSHKSKTFLLVVLKKIYIGLQYIVRFVRRNIIITAKKMQDAEPGQMLQELRKERDRIMNEQ